MKTTIDTGLTFDHDTQTFTFNGKTFATEAEARRGQTVTVDGIEYTVEGRRSVEAIAEMAPKCAAMMRAQGWAADLVVRRPKGKVEHLVRETVDGHFIYVVRL